MELHVIELVNFRNHRAKKIKIAPKTLIIGNNGKGKTNILEAIYLTLNPKEKCTNERNIFFNEEMARVSLDFHHNGTGVLAEIILSDKGKTYRENKKATNIKTAPFAVYFKPEDIKIVAGPPSDRRSFVNQVGCQMSARYHKNILDYTRVIRNKNKLLKIGRCDDSIDVWNNKIAKLGAEIYVERKKMCSEIEKTLKVLFGEFKEGGVNFNYISQAEGQDPEKQLENLIKIKKDDEIRRKISLVGTHVDDVEILTGGINLTKYGSHGQQRTVAFLLRMSQVGLLEERWGQKPVILLDDVKSELDLKHQQSVEKILSGENQVITTSTEKCFNEENFLTIEI